MSNQSPEALLAVIDNGGSSTPDREDAIHQLKEFPTPAVIDRPIRALEDHDEAG